MRSVVTLAFITILGLTGCARPNLPAVPNLANNSVDWSTVAVALTADDFFLEADGKRYLANVKQVEMRSDPGTPTRRTLELTWQEQGVEMRLHMYFTADADHWWVDEIRTYNGQNPGDWISYKGVFFKSNINTPFSGDLDLVSDGNDPEQPIKGRLHFRNITLAPRPIPEIRPNETGPVHVLAPLTGTTLVGGQSVTVNAVIDVPYAVESVAVELWDITTGWKHDWRFPKPSGSKTVRLNQILEVPKTAPPGNDYRLHIMAQPVTGGGGALGYSLKVKVVDAP